MKFLILIVICTVAVTNTATAQCNNGSKIQSPVVQKPTEAAVASVNCNTLVVQWKGNTNQIYEINVTVKDAATDETINTITTKNYKAVGQNYIAEINVTPNTKVSWSVQGISIVGNRTFYSYQLRGKEYVIPTCTTPVIASNTTKEKALQVIEDKRIGVKIYPNPVQFILHVEFERTGATQKIISLYNAAGQSILMKQTTENTAQIDVRQLASGTYFIRINDADGKVLFNGKVIKE